MRDPDPVRLLRAAAAHHPLHHLLYHQGHAGVETRSRGVPRLPGVLASVYCSSKFSTLSTICIRCYNIYVDTYTALEIFIDL